MLVDILKKSLELNASDVILSAGVKPSLKVFGDIVTLNKLERLTKEKLKKIAFEIMSEHQQEEFIKTKELDFSISLGEVRFRVNAFVEKKGFALVFRLIPFEVPDFDMLGLPSVLKELTKKKNGLVLITGSVGSGKSTTMASLIEEVNKASSKHIITVEDPVEFYFDNKKSLIEQREVGISTLSYENGLKYSLRQASDVIMIGEMRDLESFRLALRAAETGNLVLATLHTSGAARTVSRIIDMFPSGEKDQIRSQLAGSLLGVVWQKLIKKADGEGRVPAVEIMLNTTSVSSTIRRGDIHQLDGIIETSFSEGMITMHKTLDRLKEMEIISDEVYKEEILFLGKKG